MTRRTGVLLGVIMVALWGMTLLADESQDVQSRTLTDSIQPLDARVTQVEKCVLPKTGESTSANSADQGPPRIVATAPAVAATHVDTGKKEITVTFDRDMAHGFSWTGGGEYYPPLDEDQTPYWRNARTAVLPVKLEAGHYYRVGINSKSHRNFRSAAGRRRSAA